MENGVSPVSCPVCTLYMREGVRLKKHLDTHPKDLLIVALVRISAGDSPGTTENQSDNQTSVAGHGNQEIISDSQCFSPSSRNGCATNTVIPQYISISAIPSAPGADHSPSDQAAFMQKVYNPFLVQQQQQFSPSFQQPFMRLVMPSFSTHHVPQPQINVASVPVPPTVPYPANGFPTGHVPQKLQNAGNVFLLQFLFHIPLPVLCVLTHCPVLYLQETLCSLQRGNRVLVTMSKTL